MKDKKFLGFLAYIGLVGLATWLMARKEKKSGFDMPDLEGGAKGAANALTFTLSNPTGSPQSINLFDANTLKPLSSATMTVSSTPDLQYFINTLHQEPKKLTSVEIRSKNPQQLTQSMNVQLKDANGQQVNTPVLPITSAYQAQGDIAFADLDGMILDTESSISNYTVLPKTDVTIIINWE